MRLNGLDIARFFAFTGMVLVNFRIAAQVVGHNDWAANLTQLLEGRAAALFVVLAGVGISLANADAMLMAKRALFLFAIGLLNQTIFEADILHYYGVYFLCAIPMMWLTSRGLIIAAVTVLALSVTMLIALDYEAGWNWDTLQYADFWTLRGFIRNLFYNGWHPVLPWFVFLLAGMWIGRLDLSQRNAQIKLLLVGGGWAVLMVFCSTTLSTDAELADIVGLSPIPPGPFYVLAGIGTSTAVIGLCLLITPFLERVHIASWLATPGRQTLTLYVAHILLGMGLLEAMGKLDGSLSSRMIFGISLGFAGMSILYTKIWAQVSRRGPLEGLMRVITERRA